MSFSVLYTAQNTQLVQPPLDQLIAELNAAFPHGGITAADITAATPAPLNGVADGSDAGAGIVGEYQTVTGGSVSLTTNMPADSTTLSLTAGDWDVWGVANIQGSANYNQYICGISTASATTPGAQLQFNQSATSAVFGAANLFCPTRRLSFAMSTTVYLVVQASFVAGTSNVTGSIYARRRR